ncbi:unnamed protein product, partial [Didymodactylos carnosus]
GISKVFDSFVSLRECKKDERCSVYLACWADLEVADVNVIQEISSSTPLPITINNTINTNTTASIPIQLLSSSRTTASTEAAHQADDPQLIPNEDYELLLTNIKGVYEARTICSCLTS